MIRKFALLALPLALSFAAFSQSAVSIKKTARPDIPGTFVLEYGFNRDMTGPANFNLFFWASRTVNIYYQYDLRIMKSRFSVVPGIGLSLERYGFKFLRTLRYSADGDSVRLMSRAEAQGQGYSFVSIKKSKLITDYLEIPIEFRYTSKPEDPARAFKVGIGGRVGYLFDSFTKVKYHANGEDKKFKDHQSYFLNKFRYGVFAKVGFGNFSIFGYYNLNYLFQKGKFPAYFDPKVNAFTGKDFSTMTVGISLASF